jgi:site-specific DNA-methyltransferase (adenine-specific)
MKNYNTEFLNLTCENNLDLMSRIADNYFDLAIVDPPYGLTKSGIAKKGGMGGGKLKNRILNKNAAKFDSWDKVPSQHYFNELFRVSKNQIIWGGNYFELGPCRCFIAWDKVQPWENFSQVEYAWTSFDKPAKLFKFDNRTGDKIHPTQKPVNLYNWILKNFAQPGFKILDTHLGSGSIAIACHYFGLHLTACEIDLCYFKDAVKRIKVETIQTKLFQNESTTL